MRIMPVDHANFTFTRTALTSEGFLDIFFLIKQDTNQIDESSVVGSVTLHVTSFAVCSEHGRKGDSEGNL